MKNFYTIDDILNMLHLKFNYIWDTKVKDVKTENGRIQTYYRSATIEDFEQQCKKNDNNQYESITLRVYPVQEISKPTEISIYVDRTSFKVANYFDIHYAPFYTSYDESWQDLLYHEHPDEFGNEYLVFLKKRAKEIWDKAPVKGFFKKHKYLVGKELETYNALQDKIEKVTNYLNRNTDMQI